MLDQYTRRYVSIKVDPEFWTPPCASMKALAVSDGEIPHFYMLTSAVTILFSAVLKAAEVPDQKGK